MANDGIVVVREGRIVLANRAFREMLGLDKMDVTGATLEDVLGPLTKHLRGDHERLTDWGAAGSSTFTLEIGRTSSQRRVVEVTTGPLVYDGTPAVVAVVHDITERVRLEAAMKESELKYKTLFNSSPIAYFTLTPSGTIKQANEAAYELLKYEEGELLRRNIRTFIVRPKEGPDVIQQVLDEVMQGKMVTDIEVEVRRSDGEKRWVSVTARVLPTAGQTREIAFMASDIHRRKVAERREREERARADLYLEVMTHDLNNVNQSLMLSLELLEQTVELPERAQEMLRQTTWSIRRSARMIANMRALMTLRDSPPPKEPFDLAHALQIALDAVENDYPWKSLRLNTNIAEGRFIARAHKYLVNVFLEILHNSMLFTDEDEACVDITASLDESTDRIRVEIVDRGPGVPDGLKEAIFRRTGEPSHQDVGRGLGLTVVDNIVRDLEGRIWVEDRVPGDHTQGARFVFEVPVWRPQRELPCGCDNCIKFYTSERCLFCRPTKDIVLAVMEEMGVPRRLITFVDVDDPSTGVDPDELPMLPTVKICDTELTGLVSDDQVRTALTALVLKPCCPL